MRLPTNSGECSRCRSQKYLPTSHGYQRPPSPPRQPQRRLPLGPLQPPREPQQLLQQVESRADRPRTRARTRARRKRPMDPPPSRTGLWSNHRSNLETAPGWPCRHSMSLSSLFRRHTKLDIAMGKVKANSPSHPQRRHPQPPVALRAARQIHRIQVTISGTPSGCNQS